MRLSYLSPTHAAQLAFSSGLSGGFMLQNIRDNSQGWIAKTIIGVIVVLLALTGFDAIFTATSKRDEAAEVNGEVISKIDLSRAADTQRRQLQQQMGKDFDVSLLDDKLLNEAALKGLIDRQLLLQASADAGFALSEQALDQVILQQPQFQDGGKFSAERFDMVIQQMGYTRQQFRQMLKEQVLINLLSTSLAASNFVTDAEISAFVRMEKQTRDFATVTIPAQSEGVEVSDADIQSFYTEHEAQLMSPEQVQLEYVELKKDGFFEAVEVTDEDLNELYQKEIANLAEQRQAAHILIEVNDKVSDAEAKAKLDAAKQRLDQGEDFSALAKELSEDPGSAKAGGDLGYAGPGVYDPEFEASLYALKQDEISAPVRSQFGWHLIKLLGVQSAEIPTLASLKEKLVRELKSQKVEQAFVEASKALEDSAFESADLQQPAQELGLEVKTTELFGRQGGDGVAANRQVLLAAFSDEVLVDGANSAVIELDPETVVVIRVKEHKKSEVFPLEQVSDRIRAQLVQQRAAASAKLKGEELLAQLRSGNSPADKAVAEKAWTVVEAVARNQEGVDPETLQTVFRMPKPTAKDAPEFAGVAQPNGDFVLLRLSGVSEPATDLSEEDKQAYKRFLGSRSGQQDFSAYRKQLETDAEIEKF